MRRTYDTDRFYKDTMNKKLSGVCSGIARHYNKPRWVVRGLTLISLLVFPVAVGVSYLLASLLMPSR